MGKSVIEAIGGGLVVSCQAMAGEPFDRPEYLALMAKAAQAGGAVAIRADRPENVKSIRNAVDVPVIALYKRRYPDSDVYITPTFSEADALVRVGADAIAIDATNRSRPNGADLSKLIKGIRDDLGLPVLADVSTIEEGTRAEGLGADMVATTLSGYTEYSRRLDGPDFQLIEELRKFCSIPIVAEGRFWSPKDVRTAFELGAHAVVVGTAITRPNKVTERFAAAASAASGATARGGAGREREAT